MPKNLAAPSFASLIPGSRMKLPSWPEEGRPIKRAVGGGLVTSFVHDIDVRSDEGTRHDTGEANASRVARSGMRLAANRYGANAHRHSGLFYLLESGIGHHLSQLVRLAERLDGSWQIAIRPTLVPGDHAGCHGHYSLAVETVEHPHRSESGLTEFKDHETPPGS